MDHQPDQAAHQFRGRVLPGSASIGHSRVLDAVRSLPDHTHMGVSDLYESVRMAFFLCYAHRLSGSGCLGSRDTVGYTLCLSAVYSL